MSEPTSTTSLERSARDYAARFDHTWPDDATTDRVRFVVLDCETTGLDARRHRIISIGAIGVVDGQIVLGDGFEALLRVRFNTEATLVHGITRDETRAGMAESEAMAQLLDYLGDAVIVGHHIGHDIAMINAALERNGAPALRNRQIDTGLLVALLQSDGAFAAEPSLRGLSLDRLCALFDVVPYDRHTAPGDAFLTAQVFLRLMRLAARHGRRILAALVAEPATAPTPPGARAPSTL